MWLLLLLYYLNKCKRQEDQMKNEWVNVFSYMCVRQRLVFIFFKCLFYKLWGSLKRAVLALDMFESRSWNREGKTIGETHSFALCDLRLCDLWGIIVANLFAKVYLKPVCAYSHLCVYTKSLCAFMICLCVSVCLKHKSVNVCHHLQFRQELLIRCVYTCELCYFCCARSANV